MKTGLTSIDIYFLARELGRELNSARVDKVYQISDRELKIKAHIPQRGSAELIIAPNYLCLTKYIRDVPEQPSSFAMQLRKHLKGSIITGVKQHGFDRILEFELKKGDLSYLLITELFGKGNVFICTPERKILGLLEWQRWRDRMLGVGQTYEHPPGGVNPLEIDYQGFCDILRGSEKSLASTLATDLGLSGIYAEELCFRSGIEKDKTSKKLGADEIQRLFNSLKQLIEAVKGDVKKPMIVFDEDGRYQDAIPFNLSIYDKFKKKEFTTLNEAVDSYFIESESTLRQKTGEEKIQEKLERTEKIWLEQKNTIQELEKQSTEYQRIGDLLYQNFQTIDEIIKTINRERNEGASWSSIIDRFTGRRFDGVEIKKVEENGLITLEAD